MLRKFIYLDYYKETESDWYNQPYLRGHAGEIKLCFAPENPCLAFATNIEELSLDHCVDMLRESIMCHGDTTLITYHWVQGYVDPVPDFSTVVSLKVLMLLSVLI